MQYLPEIKKRTTVEKPELHLEAFDKLPKKPQVVFLQILGDLFHEDIDEVDLKQLGRAASAIARAEGFEAHARAVEKRLNTG